MKINPMLRLFWMMNNNCKREGAEMLNLNTQKELLAVAKSLLKHEALEMCARLDEPRFADSKCKRAIKVIAKAEKQLKRG